MNEIPPVSSLQRDPKHPLILIHPLTAWRDTCWLKVAQEVSSSNRSCISPMEPVQIVQIVQVALWKCWQSADFWPALTHFEVRMRLVTFGRFAQHPKHGSMIWSRQVQLVAATCGASHHSHRSAAESSELHENHGIIGWFMLVYWGALHLGWCVNSYNSWIINHYPDFPQ